MEKTEGTALCRRCRYKLPAHMRMPLEGITRKEENVVERAMIMSQGDMLDGANALLFSNASPSDPVPPKVPVHARLEEMERAHITRVLDSTRWVIEGDRGAARILGLNPSTLRGRLRTASSKWRTHVAARTSFDDVAAAGSLSSLAHTMYHLGAVRQILAAQQGDA
jgi:hypothetical protein